MYFYFQIRRLGNGLLTSLVDRTYSNVITLVAPSCTLDVTGITTATIGRMNPIVVHVRVCSLFIIIFLDKIFVLHHECVGHGPFLYKQKAN